MLPLDASVATRLVAPRPNITAGRTVFTYTKPLTGIPQGDSPLLLNCVLHDHGRRRSSGGRRRGHDARPLAAGSAATVSTCSRASRCSSGTWST